MAVYFAIGDIHGCYRELDILIQDLAAKFDLDSTDNQLVFLGDYVDRGDSSVEVLDYLVALQNKYPQTVFLRGNHEQMLLDQGPSAHSDLELEMKPEWSHFLVRLPAWYETAQYLFMHGGPETPDVDLDLLDQEYYLWNYHPSSLGWRGKWLVKGHTVVPDARLHNKTLFVDTGCCFGNKLSCVVLKRDQQEVVEVVQVVRLEPL